MELNRVPTTDMFASFEHVVVLGIKTHIREIRGDHGDDWGVFSKALKQEYFMEDFKHVTKRTFLEWVACPKDALSIHMYITKCKAHEAIVEEKQRRENGKEGPLKRPTRSGGRKDPGPSQEPSPQVPPPLEVSMEETSTGKKKDTRKAKGKSPTYKLQLNIEPATDLKDVLEERILNNKVEFTLGEVLGIIKHEIHEEIIDIIKRKRQTLTESIHSQGEEGSSKTHVIQLSNKKGDKNVVGWYQSSRRGKQILFVDDEDEEKTSYKSHY
ncbi:hypothetical protein L7F22_013117 [Adiantum nelumboides]|nr:hypothetical protein [Adiantum nelumboides]